MNLLIARRFLLSGAGLSISGRRTVVTSIFPDVSSPNCNYVAELHRNIDRYPDRAALIDGITGDTLSYLQLRQATLNVASGLIKHGFGKGHNLALIGSNSLEYVLALHGTVASAGAVSPLNPNTTASELVHPLHLSEASIVVTDKECLSKVREANSPFVKTIFLMGTSSKEANDHGCIPFDVLLRDNGSALAGTYAEVDADDDIAFLPFSSGTTGLPKGVMLSHNNVGVNLRQMNECYQNLVESEVAMGVLPFYHIYGLNVVLGNVLHSGGTIIVVPKFQPDSFFKVIDTYKISFLHVVPPLVLFLVQTPLLPQFSLSSIRKITSASAPLGEDLEIKARAALSSHTNDVQIYQGYGLTETSPYTHCGVCQDNDVLIHKKLGSIGRALSSQECKIINPNTKEELSTGEIGELIVRGPNIMRGYLKRPDATAESIDPDGWFYTGDIGWYDDDQFFYITDRAKELIKYKGMQVAPAELESVLLSHPSIVDCAVVGKPDERAGEVPVAFVVRKNEEIQDSDIHAHMASILSDYKMLRGGIHYVSEIPKSASGKILRRKLKSKLQ